MADKLIYKGYSGKEMARLAAESLRRKDREREEWLSQHPLNQSKDKYIVKDGNCYLVSSSSNPIKSSCVGVFWLDRDYSGVTDIADTQDFTSADVSAGHLVQPAGGHYYHNFDRDIPRGRVELKDGKLRLFLGEDFPRDKLQPIIEDVIKAFNLQSCRNLIMPVFHYHWNVKDK